MLRIFERWRKELTSWFNSFKKPPVIPPVKIADKLCTVTFLYTAKGVIGGNKEQKFTAFAWIQDGTTTHDCISLFNPLGIGKAQCKVHDIIVFEIPTVTPKPKDE